MQDTEAAELTEALRLQRHLYAMAHQRLDLEDVTQYEAMSSVEVETALGIIGQTINGAQKMMSAVDLLKEEIENHREKGNTGQLDQKSLHARLLGAQKPPFEYMVRFNMVADALLKQAGLVISDIAYSMVTFLPKQEKKIGYSPVIDPLVTFPQAQEEIGNTIHVTEAETRGSRLAAEVLLKIIRKPDTQLGPVISSLAGNFTRTYLSWQKSVGTTSAWLTAYTIKDPETETDVSSPHYSPQEIIMGLQSELQSLLDMHANQVREFRPPWNKMQKSGLRPLSNKLLLLGANREFGTAHIPSETAKRLTGLLHALTRLGAAPEASHATFSALISNEHVIESNIGRILSDLPSDVSRNDLKWQPVSRDIDFLLKYWNSIRPQVLELWPSNRNTGTNLGAIQAIEASLQIFKQARRELSHPELRLAGIARSLGSVALPPEPSERAVSASTFRREAASDTLRTIAANEIFAPNIRQRAEVISHFMDVANSQRQPNDREDFGELYLSDPVRPSNIRYFCITFRSPDNKEWALLESLTIRTATFAIPMELAREYGTLWEFVADFGKKAQQELGTHRIVHKTGWTTETHIQSIVDRISPAKENDTL